MLFAKPADVESFCESLSEGDAASMSAIALNQKYTHILADQLGWRNLEPSTVCDNSTTKDVFQYIKFHPCCDCKEILVRVQAGYPQLNANECDDIVLDVPSELKNAILCALCEELGQCGKRDQGFGDTRSSTERFVTESWLSVRNHSLKNYFEVGTNRIDLRLPNIQEVRIFELDCDTETYFTDDSFLEFNNGVYVDRTGAAWDEDTNAALNELTDFELRSDGLICEVCYCEPCCSQY